MYLTLLNLANTVKDLHILIRKSNNIDDIGIHCVISKLASILKNVRKIFICVSCDSDTNINKIYEKCFIQFITEFTINCNKFKYILCYWSRNCSFVSKNKASMYGLSSERASSEDVLSLLFFLNKS